MFACADGVMLVAKMEPIKVPMRQARVGARTPFVAE
jgi:hypothetical protein